LRRAVPSFTVELRRRPRLATNSSQNPRLPKTKILQAPFERESRRVAAAEFKANTLTSPADVAQAKPTGRILPCLFPDEPPLGQPRETPLSSSSSDITSRPQSRRRARASGGGDQTKKSPRNSGSSPIENTTLQETGPAASYRSSGEPPDEITGVSPSAPTMAPNQGLKSSGGPALTPKAKRRRQTQVSLDSSAEPLVSDRQSTKVDFTTTRVSIVVELPRQSRQRNIMGRYVFGDELKPGERWKRRPINR
jgi:hypothetical protein